MNTKKLIKQPTIKNLTKFAVENAIKVVANFEKIPTVFYCIGDSEIMRLEFSQLPTAKAKDLFGLMSRHLCVAGAAKANIVIADACVASPDEEPGEILAITVEIPGLQVIYLYSIDRDKTGKPKLGKLLQMPDRVPVNPCDQLLPIGIPSPAERIQALTAFAEAPSSMT